MRNDWVVRRLQFGVLYRVFLMRVVDLELLSEDADPTKLVGQFATIFASVSFFLTIPILFGVMSGGRMSESAAWTGEHFFIATSMAVAGVLSVLTWDSAFPDKRDLLVLAPLPVEAGTLFAAKVAAMFAGPCLAIFALNIFTGLGWPLMFGSHTGSLLHPLMAWPAYCITMLAGGAFVFCVLLTLQGVAANLLPRQVFLRASAFLQAGALCGLLSVYFLEPSLESPKALMAVENQRLLYWLPTYWFLGMFQQINGSMHPAMVPLARRAWFGLGLSVLGATVTMLLSYFRMMPKIVEQPEIEAGRSRRLGAALAGVFGRSLHGTITLFSARSMMRSRQHRMILSFYVGIGLAMLVGYLRSGGRWAHSGGEISIAFLVASAVVMILPVMAIRVVAAMPISLRANWIFQVTQVGTARGYRDAVRWSWLVLSVAPAWLVLAGSLLALYPWRPVAEHLVVLLLLGVILVELCAAWFGKISFACSYLPGKANIHLAFWASLGLFFYVLHEAAKAETRAMHAAWNWCAMVVAMAAVAGGVRWLAEAMRSGTEEIVFEEEAASELVTLKLS